MSQQVLHLDFVSLNPSTGAHGRERLIEAATALAEVEGVLAIGVVEGEAGSDFDIAFYFVLADFTALEPFGTDPRYSRFLQGEVAPRLKSFAGTDVRLEDDFSVEGSFGAVVALIGPEETYDWEVRDALRAWTTQTGATSSAVGVAVGERQAYRGAGLAFGDTLQPASVDEPFRATTIFGRARKLT